MLVSINNAIQQTWIFSIVLFLAVIISVRPRKITEWFPVSLTAELKGLAILMIVLSHIGYFLATDTNFLWPLSIMAGVGVNLFLFLSGFGLAVSQMKNDLSAGKFYKKRLGKLFLPLWLSLLIFFCLDIFVLGRSYPWEYIVKSFFGIFTHADLYQDVNSPLWYFTFILGYYILFPFVFSRKRPWLSAAILYLAGYAVVRFEPAVLDQVMHLYKIHIIAFPLGVLAAWLVSRLKRPEILAERLRGWQAVLYYSVLAGAAALFIYANHDSGIGVGPGKEQLMSLVAVLAISLIFVLKEFESRVLYWIGIYSYEIYLFHWPIMYRYDIFFRFLPPWLAVSVYIAFLTGLGWLVSKVIGSAAVKKKTPSVPGNVMPGAGDIKL